jgi:type I restriction-modification system DNA methylase subunit
MIDLTTLYLNKKMDDFLGKVYMELDLGSKGHAQFFTPYTISKMTAKMTLSSSQFENNKTLTMSEPAAGSGGMAIAACDTLQEYNIDYKKQLRIIAQDINWNAVKMTYIQLSSINAQAHVVYGNTITHEEIAKYCTPEAIKSNWK